MSAPSRSAICTRWRPFAKINVPYSDAIMVGCRGLRYLMIDVSKLLIVNHLEERVAEKEAAELSNHIRIGAHVT